MITPPQPKTMTAEEIQKKHEKIDLAFKGFSEDLTAAMKRHSLRQRAVLKYGLTEIYAYINVYPYDWDKGTDLKDADEASYKAFSEDLKAAMRKYGLRQQAFVKSDAEGLHAQMNVYPYEWSKDDADGRASAEVDPSPQQEAAGPEEVTSENNVKKNKKGKGTKAKEAGV